MLNRSASLTMSTSVLNALPGKLDIKRHSPSIRFLFINTFPCQSQLLPLVAYNANIGDMIQLLSFCDSLKSRLSRTL